MVPMIAKIVQMNVGKDPDDCGVQGFLSLLNEKYFINGTVFLKQSILQKLTLLLSSFS